jgi:hypothetical protein
VEVNGDEACKGPNSTNRGGAKSTGDPKSGVMLHLGEFGNLALPMGTRVIPELEAICCNGHNTQPVKDAFLLGGQSMEQVPKHSHGMDRRDCFGSIEAHMLMEEQVMIKEEAKVPPMFLGLQWGFLSKWPPSESQRGVSISTLACEVEKFGLVMFQDKPKALKQIKDNPVCLSEAFEVASPVLSLDDESSVIYVGLYVALETSLLSHQLPSSPDVGQSHSINTLCLGMVHSLGHPGMTTIKKKKTTR